MICLEPIYLKELKVSVPCGRCPKCRAKKSQDWQFRLYQEYRHAESAYFLTITYNEDHIPIWINKETGEYKTNLVVKDLQAFIKALRKKQDQYQYKYQKRKTMQETRQNNARIRYYAVGEYGDQTDRAHYHMLLFNVEPIIKNRLDEIWKKGHVHIGTCNAKTIAYTLKYVLKTPTKRTTGREARRSIKQQTPFSISSRNPAIGYQYLTTHRKYHITTDTTTVRDINGNKIPLPLYYKDKIFGKIQRDRLNLKSKKYVDEAELKEDLRICLLNQIPEKYYNEQLKNYLRKVEKNNRKKTKL